MSYFLQPTPGNIQSMILTLSRIMSMTSAIDVLAVVASQAIYHPDATELFESFESYAEWYAHQRPKSQVQSPKSGDSILQPESTVGLLLMRPQIVSKARKHYDALIHAIEAEGLSVIPAISTLMDNREAVEKFFVGTQASGRQFPEQASGLRTMRVSQIVSLTGFSLSAAAMNDEAAAEYLKEPMFRIIVPASTRKQSSRRESFTG
jgi:cobalamin biosynthesis Mg chelatase CobN